MSGLDVAAGVIGIAVVGIKAAKGLVEIADAIGNTGQEVRLCASDIALFSQLLNELGDALRKPTAASRATQNLAEDIMDACETIFTPFNNLIAKLTPLLDEYRQSQHQFRQLSLRIQWCFKHKSKVVFYQQSLSHLKGTLSCLLASMNLKESRMNSPQKVLYEVCIDSRPQLIYCSIHHMQVESFRASMEQQGRSDRATLGHTVSSLHNDRQMSPAGRRIEAVASTPEPDAEEPLDHSGPCAAISNPADTAVALHIDLLSLQGKTLKFAKSALDPGVSQDQRRPDEQVSVRPTTEQEKVVYWTDPSKYEHSFPFEKCKTYWGAVNMVRWKLSSFTEEARLKLKVCIAGEVDVTMEDWPSRISPGMSIYHDYDRP